MVSGAVINAGGYYGSRLCFIHLGFYELNLPQFKAYLDQTSFGAIEDPVAGESIIDQ